MSCVFLQKKYEIAFTSQQLHVLDNENAKTLDNIVIFIILGIYFF